MAAGRRLSLGRLAGVAAWAAATVTWGTVGVAIGNQGAVSDDANPVEPDGTPPPVVENQATSPGLPTLPERGLVVLTYTPSVRPEPKVIVIPQTAPSTAPTKRVRSSGS